jgi:hypothetical protein
MRHAIHSARSAGLKPATTGDPARAEAPRYVMSHIATSICDP